MKNLRRVVTMALWIPLLWLLGVIITISLSGGPAANPVIRFFEGVVFFTSFLLYRAESSVSSLGQHPTELFVRFALQFFFWWLIGFVVFYWLERRRSKSQ